MQSIDYSIIEKFIQRSIEEAVKRIQDNSFSQTEYLNTEQAAKYLNLSKQRLESWRITGQGPQFIKINCGQAVRYKREHLDEFMLKNSKTNTINQKIKGN